MTTTEMLAKAQFLALQEQVSPGHPEYEKDFRQLLLEMATHLEELNAHWKATLDVTLETNEFLHQILARKDALLAAYAARITQLTATLERLAPGQEGRP